MNISNHLFYNHENYAFSCTAMSRSILIHNKESVFQGKKLANYPAPFSFRRAALFTFITGATPRNIFIAQKGDPCTPAGRVNTNIKEILARCPAVTTAATCCVEYYSDLFLSVGFHPPRTPGTVMEPRKREDDNAVSYGCSRERCLSFRINSTQRVPWILEARENKVSSCYGFVALDYNFFFEAAKRSMFGL